MSDGATKRMDEDEAVPQSLAPLCWELQEAGLPLPPIPLEFAKRLRELDTWLHATREVEFSPWDIEMFVHEAAAGETPDYLLVAQAGHGIDSWALHYYLVDGPLRIFLQLPGGGPYTDEQTALDHIRDCFSTLEDFIPAAQDRLAADEHLYVVESVAGDSRWAVCGVDTTPAQIPWQEARNAPLAALVALQRQEG